MNTFSSVVVQILFLILVIMALVWVIKFFRNSVSKKISSEWRAIFLMAVLGTIALVAMVGFVKIGGWKTSDPNSPNYMIQQEAITSQLNIDEHEYLQAVYLPLDQSYKQLQINLEGIDTFKKRIIGLRNEYPNHKKLLENILEDFNKEETEQRKLYNKIHREIRYAIIQSSTQDTDYIDKQFTERAKKLNKKVVAKHKSMDAKIKKAAARMESSLGEARRILTRGSSKSGTKVEEHSFTAEMQNKLSAFLYTKSPDLSQQTTYITQEIMLAEGKKEMMRQLSMQNQDLMDPLTKTMRLWHEAEVSARRHWGDILYAVEAIYLADQLNMPEHNPAYRLLFKTLEKQSATKLAKIKKKRTKVEQSFISPEYVKKTK